MGSIGIDLHKRESQLCTITEDGELLEQRIVTSRERFTAVLGARTLCEALQLGASICSPCGAPIWGSEHRPAIQPQSLRRVRACQLQRFVRLQVAIVDLKLQFWLDVPATDANGLLR